VKIRKSFMIVVAATAFVAGSCGSDDTAVESSARAESTADADCPPVDGSGEQLQAFDGPPPDCLDSDATYQALVVTNKGEFTIELDAESAPVTTNNFVFLARNQYFDNTECHRIIPGFVVQCGDPTATGTGGPGYTITDEPPSAGEYQIGSIAMANTGAPDSGGSQFFIITGEQGAALPPQYSLFGEVIEGFDGTVVQMEAAGSAAGNPSEPIEIESITIIQS
jgi:cyclophilin family peptidyl-prolyl cis-trans isomerase